MPVVIDNQEIKYDHSIWALITQYLLSEDTRDEDIDVELMAGTLFQTMRALGLPPDSLRKFGENVIGIARQARKHIFGGRPNLPVYIRLFCQKTCLVGLPDVEKPTHGGWGYYIIERGGDFPSDFRYNYPRVVELYLYKEGD